MDITAPPTLNADYFIPLSLTLPAVDKEALQSGVVQSLLERHKNDRRLYFNPEHTLSHKLDATRAVADGFLNPFGLRAETMGIFIVCPNLFDKNVHVDAGKLEARINFYDLTTGNGAIRWFPDTGDGYNDYDVNLGGTKILDYTYPWVMDLKAGKIDWDNVPATIFESTTNAPSALVRTNLPHHVIQGNGWRVTVTARIVDIVTGSTDGAWEKIKTNIHNINKGNQ
jgi:hypothetical protein